MENYLIGDVNLYKMFMYFFIFGFLGWVTEVVFQAIKTGKFINRGFLNGPICPIYGIGMSVLILLLNPLEKHWYLLFFVGGIFCSLLELVTGFVLDKIFKTKWWDYSKEKFNFKGYICLRFAFIWGFAVVLLFNTIVPLSNKVISFLPYRYFGMIFIIVSMSVLVIDLISVVIQLKIIKDNISEAIGIAKILHEGSDKLGKKISDTTLKNKELIEKLSKEIKSSRLGKAYPKLSAIHEKMLLKLEEYKNKKTR